MRAKVASRRHGTRSRARLSVSARTARCAGCHTARTNSVPPVSASADRYTSHLAMTSPMESLICWLACAAACKAAASTFPTANGNEPVVTWPSTAESAFHATVYTPSGRERSETVRWVESAGSSLVSPLSTCAPLELRTVMVLKEGSSVSVKKSSICAGARSSVALASGTERASSACAKTGAARRRERDIERDKARARHFILVNRWNGGGVFPRFDPFHPSLWAWRITSSSSAHRG